MPRGTSRNRVGGNEVLLFPAGLDAIKNVVVNASVPLDADNRRRLIEGTLLKKAPGVGPGGVQQYVRYNGTGTVEGILALDVEFIDGSSNNDTPRGMFYHGCVFRTSAIVDWSLYGTAAKNGMFTCRFEDV